MPTLNLNYNIIEAHRRKAVGPYPIQMEYLIVGGGGGSSNKTGFDTVGGGGAGGFITGSYCFSPGETQTFTIGAGGALQTNGTNSTGFGLTAIGGGSGARNINGVPTNAGNGGSGGGGVENATFGTGSLGQGFDGGVNGAINFGGGGGGGAAEVGGTSTSNAGAPGGNGKQWLDGVYYAGGGGGSQYLGSSAPSGINGLGYQIGGGGGSLDPGTTGIVAVRYLTGERVVVTNGSTVNVGNFTYHYFTSGTGSIQFIGDEQQDPNINPCQ